MKGTVAGTRYKVRVLVPIVPIRTDGEGPRYVSVTISLGARV